MLSTDATELQKTASKVKKAAEQWKEMTSEEKKPYEDRAAEASAAYKEEVRGEKRSGRGGEGREGDRRGGEGRGRRGEEGGEGRRGRGEEGVMERKRVVCGQRLALCVRSEKEGGVFGDGWMCGRHRK